MSSPRVIAGSARGRRLRGACPERSEWVPGDKTRPITAVSSVIARRASSGTFSAAARRGNLLVEIKSARIHSNSFLQKVSTA